MPSLSGSLRLTATGHLDDDAVWSRYTEPRRWTSWAPHLVAVDYPHRVVEPGTTGRVTGVGGLVAVFRIEAVDHAQRTWSWSVRSGPVRVAFDHGVEAHDSGSTAWVVTHGPWPVLAGYGPLARWSLQRLVTP